jgi:hypothetical protein
MAQAFFPSLVLPLYPINTALDHSIVIEDSPPETLCQATPRLFEATKQAQL